MKKGIAIIPVLLLMLLIGGGIFLGLKYQPRKNEEVRQKPSDIVQVTQTISEIPADQTSTQPTAVVPLPTEEDIIRNFFNLINEKRIPEAISMLSQSAVGDDSSKQAWGVQFNAVKSINVQKIEPSMPESWSQDSHSYKVTLEAYVSSDAANAPIPYYGWGDNPNLRWVSITKEGDLWKINELATGP